MVDIYLAASQKKSFFFFFLPSLKLTIFPILFTTVNDVEDW